MRKDNAEGSESYFSRRQCAIDRALIARGIDPYNSEFRTYGDVELNVKRVSEDNKGRNNTGRDGRVPDEIYLRFLDEVKDLYVETGDWSRYTETKSSLLRKYFPARFGEDGVQDLDRKKYDKVQIGAIFNNILNNAKRIEREELERAKSKGVRK